MAVNWDRVIGVAGALLSLGGMLVSIFYANQARSTKHLIDDKYRKLSFVDVRLELRNALSECERLRQMVSGGGRGLRITRLTGPLRASLHAAIGRLPPDCVEQDLRSKVLDAQGYVRDLERGQVPDPLDTIERLSTAINEGIGISRQLFEFADSQEV
jgi:hypothetical protein